MGRLFWKIFFAFWLALVAAAAGSGAAVWWHRHARDSAEPQLAVGPPQMFATEMAAATLRHGGVAALREWMEETGRVRRVRVFAVDAAGNDLLGRAVPEGALSRARELAAESGHTRAAQIVAAPGGESYLLFVPHTALAPPPPPLPVSPWMLIVIGAATSLAVSAILAWYLARPIRSLRWAFDAAAGGRLETRVRPLMGRRRDEIADLGRDFDRMAQQLQKLVTAQRRLLHDVSHELRSPLARLQAAIGLVRQSPQKLDGSLERIEREATRLSELVGEVLTLARLESVNPAAAEPVELAEVVASVAEDARFEAQAAGRDVSFQGVGGAIVRGRAELLHRAVENVVRNAVKYTAPGSTVDIAMHLEVNPPRAVVSVTDRGPGIAPEDLGRIFEPFYRTESDAGGAQGFGLGLAIAQRAIEAHGGQIRAANIEGGGLRMEIALPSFTQG
jgi:two-component system, OmpR family, sensor kinase